MSLATEQVDPSVVSGKFLAQTERRISSALWDVMSVVRKS